MIFAGDLSGYQVAVTKELPIEAGTYVNGALLQLNITASTNYCELPTAAPANIIGLYADLGATITGTIALGTISYRKVIVNPNAAYMAEYDKAAAITCTNYAAGTWTVTHDGQAGGWIFSNTSTDASYGLLMYAASVVATTSFTSTAVPTSATPTTTDDLIYVHPHCTGPGAAAGMEIDVTADATEILTDGTYTGTSLVCIQSFVTGDSLGGYQVLKYAHHNNTQDSSYRFFSLITPRDHALTG